MKKFIAWKIFQIRNILREQGGISTIELVLILVVAIGLIVIFKSQLTTLIQSIFSKITSESAGI